MCAVIANSMLRPKEPFEIEDFMPQQVGGAEEQTPDQQLMLLRMLNSAVGGKVVER